MRRRMCSGLFAFLACVGLVAPASIAHARTKEGHFAVEDAGRVPCSIFTKARAAKGEAMHRYVGFVEGYITAANRYEPNTFDLTPWHTPEAIAVILDGHCKKFPNDNLARASQQLVAAMAPFRLANFSKLVEVGDAGKKTVVYVTILQRAQSELTRKGLYKGEANGSFNPEFRNSLKQFQTLAKLDPTGLPDTRTLWMLLQP